MLHVVDSSKRIVKTVDAVEDGGYFSPQETENKKGSATVFLAAAGAVAAMIAVPTVGASLSADRGANHGTPSGESSCAPFNPTALKAGSGEGAVIVGEGGGWSDVFHDLHPNQIDFTEISNSDLELSITRSGELGLLQPNVEIAGAIACGRVLEQVEKTQDWIEFGNAPALPLPIEQTPVPLTVAESYDHTGITD